MAFSLPGMTELASSTVSPSPTRITWSRLAIRDSAAIGSPCDPVQTRAILFGGQLLQLLEGDDQALGDLEVAEVAGDAHVAHHRAADEGDLAAVRVGGVEHLLDAVHVAGEAGDDDPPRARCGRPSRSPARARRSDMVKPGTSALVESVRKRSTPSSPSRAKPRRSVIRPSSGNWSILKSPVCSTRPALVRIATARPSGMEWLTARNSQVERPERDAGRPRRTSTGHAA